MRSPTGCCLLLGLFFLFFQVSLGITYDVIRLDDQGSAFVTLNDFTSCGYQFYSLPIDTPVIGDYLRFSFTSDTNTTTLIISDSEFTPNDFLEGSAPANTYSKSGDAFTQEVICASSVVTNWYITVVNEDLGSDQVTDFQLTIATINVPIRDLTLNVPFALEEISHAQDSFVTTFDVYRITIAQTSATLGETMKVDVTLSDTDITLIALEKGSLASPDYDSNLCASDVTESSTLVIDACTYSSIVSEGANTDYYISVEVDTILEASYTIEVSTFSPTIVAINTANDISSSVPYQDGSIRYYSFQGNGLTTIATISGITGGIVDFALSKGSLPFQPCIDSSDTTCGGETSLSNCCNRVDQSCSLVTKGCDANGVLYFGVREVELYSVGVPVQYRLDLNTKGDTVVQLEDGIELSSTVLPADTVFYEFIPDVDDDDAVFQVTLYVDQTSETGSLVLILSETGIAGLGSCYSSTQKCLVDSSGSCSIQITPCYFREFDTWYISVSGGTSQTSAGDTFDYTIKAELIAPVEVEVAYQTTSISLNPGEYMHFTFDGNFFGDGDIMTFQLDNIQGGNFNVFLNFNQLAGFPDANDCTDGCYDYRFLRRTTEDSFSWPLINCNSTTDQIDNYIQYAVQAEQTTLNRPVTADFMITYVEAPDEPDELDDGELVTSSIDSMTMDEYAIPHYEETSYTGFRVSLVQVDQLDTPLVLSVYNTSLVNCVVDAYTVSCNTTNSTICSLYIPVCVFNTTDQDWLVSVDNPSMESINYNILYQLVPMSPTYLTNYAQTPSSVAPSMIKEFAYTPIISTAVTYTIELFLGSCTTITGDPCSATLTVSTEEKISPCSELTYWSESGTDKVVYVNTLCAPNFDTLFFAVTTDSVLNGIASEVPFTIIISEISASVALLVDYPTSGLLYPGQQIYYTFTYPTNPSLGSGFSVAFDSQEANVADYVVSTTSVSVCPCFELLVGNEFGYCDTIGKSQFTVIVTADTEDTIMNEKYSFSIEVSSFQQQPSPVALNGATVQGSVMEGNYLYYQLTEPINPSAINILTVSNIINGEVTVYSSEGNPATSRCNSGNLCISSDECSAPLACIPESSQFFSVYGSQANSFEPISYDFGISESFPLDLAQNIASTVTQEYGIQYFSFDMSALLPGMVSPFVSFTVTMAEPFIGTYDISYNSDPDDLCVDDLLATCNSQTCTATYSSCEVPTNLIINLGNGQLTGATYDITATVIDLAANSIASPEEGFASAAATIAPLGFRTFLMNIEDAELQQTLNVTVTAESALYTGYVGFGNVSPGCNEFMIDVNAAATTFVIDVCCVQDQTYSIVVQNLDTVAMDFTIIFDLTPTLSLVEPIPLTGNAITTNAITGDYVLREGFTQEFSFTFGDSGGYPASWVLVQVNETVSVYVEYGSMAGPVSSCLSFSETEQAPTSYFTSLQCEFNSGVLATPFLGGDVYVGLTNDGDSNSFEVDISAGFDAYIPLNPVTEVSYDEVLPPFRGTFFSIEVTATDLPQKILSVSVASNITFAANLYFGDICGTVLDTCQSLDSCVLTSDCLTAGTYIVHIPAFFVPANFTATASYIPQYPDAVELVNTEAVDVIGTGYFFVNIDITVVDYVEILLTDYTGPEDSLVVFYSLNDTQLCPLEASQLSCNGDSCALVMDSCYLVESAAYYFSVFTALDTDSYTIQYNTGTEEIIDITLNSVTQGTVFINERKLYSLDLYDVDTNLSPVFPGQSLEINLVSECGIVELFLSGPLGGDGPDCSVNPIENNATITACSFAKLPLDAPGYSILFLTVIGGDNFSGNNGQSTPYLLEVKLTGTALSYVPIGMNQAVTASSGGTNIYILPLPGVSQFIGQMQIRMNGDGSDSTLTLSLNEPLFCADNPLTTVSVSDINPDNVLLLNACDLGGTQQLYLQFSEGSSPGTTFAVYAVNPFVRDLNTYNEIPQVGAVTPHRASLVNPRDEEYYRISVDTSSPSFQFNAYITGEVIPIVLLSSLGTPPAICDGLPQTPSLKQSFAAEGSSVTYDWCELSGLPSSSQEVFMSVQLPVNQEVLPIPQEYALYYTINAPFPVPQLIPQNLICKSIDAGESEHFYLTFERNPLAIYSVVVTGPDALTFLWVSGGLATDLCTPNENVYNIDAGEEFTFDLTPCSAPDTIHVSVANPNDITATSYNIEFISQVITPVPIIVGTPVTVTFDFSDTVYFSFALPVISDSQILSISNNLGVDLYFSSQGIPTDCDNTVEFLSSCDYSVAASTTGYLMATNENLEFASLTISIDIFDIVQSNLAFDTYVSSQLLPTESNPLVVKSYKITVTEEMLGDTSYVDMAVYIYGVNHGLIQAWISEGDLGSITSQCTIDSITDLGGDESSIILTVPGCDFSSMEYYVTVTQSYTQVETQDDGDKCTPTSYGLLVTLGVSSDPVVALQSSVAQLSPVAYTQPGTVGYSYFSFSSTASIISVQVSSSSPFITLEPSIYLSPYITGEEVTVRSSDDDCDLDIERGVIQYFWGCSDLPDDFVVTVRSAPSGEGPLSLDESFVVSVASIEPIVLFGSSTPLRDSFEPIVDEQELFYSFQIDSDSSFELLLDIASGPAIVMTLYDNECSPTGDNVILGVITCYDRCSIPLAFSDTMSSDASYTLSLKGIFPSVFDIQVLSGESQTCTSPDTEFCDISWTVWDYGVGETGMEQMEQSTIDVYNNLVSYFCPPCSCPEITRSCNNSLIEFACTQSYRACSDNGIEITVCEDTCTDVENNCGVTFEQVGLPMYSCNHNTYFNDENASCESIYSIRITDPGDSLLYVVVVLVLICCTLVFVCIILYVVVKNKASRSSYEVIGEASESEEDDSFGSDDSDEPLLDD